MQASIQSVPRRIDRKLLDDDGRNLYAPTLRGGFRFSLVCPSWAKERSLVGY